MEIVAKSSVVTGLGTKPATLDRKPRFEVEWAGIERVLSSAGLPTPLELRINEPDLWRTSPQATVWRKR